MLFSIPCRRMHTRSKRDWSSDVCSSDLLLAGAVVGGHKRIADVTDMLAREDIDTETLMATDYRSGKEQVRRERARADAVDRSEERREGTERWVRGRQQQKAKKVRTNGAA